MDNIKTKTSNKRLDLELSLYLFCCLGLFFIVAILGTTILGQNEYSKTFLDIKNQSEILLNHFTTDLPTTLSQASLKSLTVTAQQFRDELLDLFNQQKTHYNLLIFAAALFTIFVLILFLFVSSWVQVRLFGPLSELIEMSSQNDALKRLASFKANSSDLEMLRNLFTKLVIHRIEKEQLEKQAAVANIAAQVAHDIRSPLAALGALESELAKMPENKRILVRSANNRIRDISNNLLEQKRQIIDSGKIIDDTQKRSPQLIAALLELIIAEKRFQYRHKLNIEIQDQFDENNYGLFALIQSIELKRILSNLINNAIDALPEGGHVKVELSSNRANIQITVIDNGNGIKEEILPRLMQPGQTYGKREGSGLGLYHARKTLESWNGKIDIHSRIGFGTKVTISLPKVPAPDWFVERILIKPSMTLVVVDDDASIHQIWQARIAPFREAIDIEMQHFSTPTELHNYLQNQKPYMRNTLYLIDYEFLGQKETGLDTIEKEGIANCSVLVTSHYEEPELRQRAEKLKVKMIPKGMAAFVPIELEPKRELYDAVLLDDDELIRSVWQRIAEDSNKRLLVFQTFDELCKNLKRIDFDTPMYIDCELKSSLRGQEVAQILQSKGFANLYLATGYDPSYFGGKVPGIKAIVDKKPPWDI